MKAGQIIVGDARTAIAELPEGSVDMVLTSPPYFRLRDYDAAGQLGSEPTVDDYVDQVALVMRGLKRVLKPSGTLWLNLGDSYASHARQGAGRKSLLLAPERIALRLTADGWLLRNKIAWVKPNPVPTSVRDRFNCAWEYLYVFARCPRYYFDLDAVRLPHVSGTRPPRRAGTAADRARERWRGPNSAEASGLARLQRRGQPGHALGKNPGDVWTIANPGLRGSHHAVFPLELARRAISAGCPPDGLVLDPFCGAGTTAVAAEALNRRWLGIELNPEFAALAGRRLNQARAGPRAKPSAA